MPTASPGRLCRARGPRTSSVPVPDGFDWDMWLGPLPWRPFGGEAGHTLSGLFVGDVNWSPHHYDIIQWTVNPDVRAPIDVKYRNGSIDYHYGNGVVVHSGGYPGEPVGPEGGACFVGTTGRIAVDRSNIVSYPAEHAPGAAAARRRAGLSCRQPFRELPGMHPHPQGRRSAIRRSPPTPSMPS